jgi:hypothetical protein
LSEGPAPALRFGSLEAATLQRLHEVSAAATALRACVRTAPVDMAALIETALVNGDECHSRTGAANNALLEAMRGLDAETRKLISSNSGFVLPVMMAAACWALHKHAAPILMAGGNGIEFGLRLRDTDAWRGTPATAPTGTRFPAHPAATVLGAIGDSAVLDFCGLGGQALSFAPALLEEWKEILPFDAARRRLSITDDKSGAIDPRQVHASGLAPIVHLAMLDRGGSGSLLGRGFYIPPVDLFNT